MKKKLLSILVLLILVAFSFDYALAATGEEISDNAGNNEASESFVYTNPVYEDVITEEKILKDTQENTGASLRNGLSRQVDYSRFEESEDAIVETLREAMTERQENIQLLYRSTSPLSRTQVDRWIEKALSETDSPVQGDYIRFVLGGSSYTIRMEEESESVFNTVDMEMVYYTTLEQEQELTAELNSVMDSFNFTESTSDYKKIETIYNYICENVTYDFDGHDDSSNTFCHTAYAALMNKTAVCQGYATLLYRMLKSAGIDSRVITGVSGAESHAWNIVKIGELYYYLDSTWDAGNLIFSFFLKGSSSFPDHECDSSYLNSTFVETYPVGEEDYAFPDDRIIESGDFRYQIRQGKATLIKYFGNDAEVTVPSSVEGYPVSVIGSLAFQARNSLKKLTIGEGVKWLDCNAIYKCTSLEDLYLPASLDVWTKGFESICGFTRFPQECNSIRAVYVAANSEYIVSIDGVVFDKALTTLLYYPPAKEDSEYTIPDGIENIGPFSFKNNKNIEKVTMPDTVVDIDYFAFYMDEHLKEINISKNCEIIKQLAFNGTAIEFLELPASLEFFDLYQTEIVSLKECTVDKDNQIFSSDQGVLLDKNKETVYLIPAAKEGEYTVPESVTTIIYGAAIESHLSRITIPVSAITEKTNFIRHREDLVICGYEGSQAQRFAESHNITFVSIGEVQATEIASGACGDNMTWSLDNKGTLRIMGSGEMSWGNQNRPWSQYINRIYELVIEDGPEDIADYAFAKAESLSSVTIPGSVKRIGSVAFWDCMDLKSIIIPEGVEVIDEEAFIWSGLEEVSLPASLRQFDGSAFKYCQLKNVTVHQDSEYYTSKDNIIFDKSGKTLVLYPQLAIQTRVYHVPEGVETVGEFAFSYALFEGIYFPDSLRTIEECAFYEGLVKHINLGEGVRQIESNAFEGCQVLDTIVIGKGLEYIGEDAFNDLLELDKIYYTGTESDWKTIDIDKSNQGLFGAGVEYIDTDLLCDQNIHILKLGKAYKDPTCTEDGNREYYQCTKCGKLFKHPVWGEGAEEFETTVDEIRLPGRHQYNDWIVTKPQTCTEDGIQERECMKCGEKSSEAIPATGHHYIDWASATPSCTGNGYTEQKCENCGDTVVIDVKPALGHIEVDIPGEAATCTEFGWSAGKKCSRCGVVLENQEIIPATGHNYTVISKKDPTCTVDGSVKKRCENCGDIVVEELWAFGHEIIELPETAATCTEPGLTAGRKCSRCGFILDPQKTIPAHGHAELYLPGVEVTCTEPGLTYGKKCCFCDEILVPQETIPAMGHEWSDAIFIDKEPTCTEPGQGSIHCTICGEIKSGTVEEIPVTAHSYGDWTTIMAATVNAEGSRERVCSVCGHKETEVIEKLPANDSKGEEHEGQNSDKPADADKSQADTDKSEESQKEGTTPADDPERMYGADGTAVGKGASAEAAEKAITSLKSDNDPAGSAFAPLLLKSTKQTKTSIKLTWRKVTGAEKYVIYGNDCGKTKKFRKLTTASGSSKTVRKAAGRKLRKGTYYKFMVVALDSNNQVVSTSKVIHVATKGKGNHTKLTTKAKNNRVTLKKGKTFRLGAKAVGKNVKKHVAVRYESSKPKVAKVSKSGKITAKKKGTCYVYAYAQNGVFKKIKVTVK